MAAPMQIKRAAQELFGETDEVVVPRLMRELKAPHPVGVALGGIYPNAVRKWLVTRGWRFDGTQWIEPSQEPEHA